MQELTLLLIRFAYLAVLWMFVLGALSVLRSDMFGARVETSPRAARREEKQSRKDKQPKKPPRGTPTQVVIVDGPSTGLSVPLDQVPILIGRGPDAAIRLDDDYVSTRHARIGHAGDTWFVEDLGSTNGTYLGASRITQPTSLQLGSRIRVGKTTLELKK